MLCPAPGGGAVAGVIQAVMKAMYYLTRNENNISEIAELCGYGSIQAFSRAFKEKSGMTPLEFRAAQLRKNTRHA